MCGCVRARVRVDACVGVGVGAYLLEEQLCYEIVRNKVIDVNIMCICASHAYQPGLKSPTTLKPIQIMKFTSVKQGCVVA